MPKKHSSYGVCCACRDEYCHQNVDFFEPPPVLKKELKPSKFVRGATMKDINDAFKIMLKVAREDIEAEEAEKKLSKK